MTAPSLADPVCMCGCAKARHKGPGMCRHCGEFECDRYEPNTEECCKGEPFRGDPNGLHTFDCPQYQKNVEGLQKLQGGIAPVEQPDTSASTGPEVAPKLPIPPGTIVNAANLTPVGVSLQRHESTSAALRRVEAERDAAIAELASARQELDRLRVRLPVTDDEIRQWYADHSLYLSCGPGVLFAALRKDFHQTQGDQT